MRIRLRPVRHSRLFRVVTGSIVGETALTLFVSTLLVHAVSAHDIITTKLTYSRDVSRIFARRCVSCHGSNAPVPLSNYEQVRPWAVSIKEQVLSRAMPPWGAVKGFGDLKPDWGLTQEEIVVVAAWVVGGAPRGEDRLLSSASPPPQSTSAEPIPNRGTVRVQDSIRLNRPLHLAGILPIAPTVDSAKITALLPDGRTLPLLWLYRMKGPHDFTFAHAVTLPQGTVVRSSVPLPFELITTRQGS